MVCYLSLLLVIMFVHDTLTNVYLYNLKCCGYIRISGNNVNKFCKSVVYG